MKKLTTDEFIARASIVHNFRYTYPKSVYVLSREKVTVTCSEHGDFLIAPNPHLRGIGCKKCGDLRTGQSQAKSKEEYLKDFDAAHRGKYDYSKSLFKKAKDKIEIICPLHLSFWQTPDKHRYQECPDCALVANGLARRMTFEEFQDKAKIVHDNKYDYISLDFKGDSYTTSICYEHGIFEQIASSHLCGAGCSGCAVSGFDRSKPAELYILTLDNITKIGITNLTAEDRCNRISKSKGSTFKIEKVFKSECGAVIDDLETELLQRFKKTHLQPTEKFEGYSECFFDINLEELVTCVEAAMEKNL